MYDEEDSFETFDSAAKRQIQYYYNNRCVFCLDKLIEEGSQCVDILNTSGEEGASRVCIEPVLI